MTLTKSHTLFTSRLPLLVDSPTSFRSSLAHRRAAVSLQVPVPSENEVPRGVILGYESNAHAAAPRALSIYFPWLTRTFGNMRNSMAFAASRRLSSVASRTSTLSRTAEGVARTQATIGSSQTTATTTRTARITASQRTASTSTSASVNSNSFRTAAGRANLRQVRTAIGSETSSLRYVGYMLDGGAEPNLVRGWDDGIVDAEGDDGT